ncbi:PRD domain-containing protein [Enterococcus faecium]|nr:PRD domain-containing protein [Enterococcus faecium]
MTSQMNRENKLVLLLSKQNHYMTSEELADLLDTSTKTVYRLVKKINTEFQNGHLILSEKGKGYKLDYEKFIERNKETNNLSISLSPNERQNRVMEELLLSSPRAIRISELFNAYEVGDSAISNDEKSIAQKLRKFDLQLIRKNRTLAIKGLEEDIRRGLAEVIWRMNILDIDEINASKTFNFNRYDVLLVSDQLKLIEKILEGGLPYPYNVNIFSHLYILISRSRKRSAPAREEELTTQQIEFFEKDNQIKKTAEIVIQNVEKYLATSLSVNESYYLYQYLVSSRMEKTTKEIKKFPEEVEKITTYYLEEVGKRINMKVTNESIFIDLANHIKPMINRLKNRIHVKNGLLDQIQLTYEKIYNSVSEVSKEVSQHFKLPLINADEIGFITLYFARMLETQQLPIQTLIMCTTGIGTSELLKAKIIKKFPDLNIVDVIATKNYRTALEKNPNIELILTTVGIRSRLGVHTLLVSAMLTADDQSRIQKKIGEIYNER